MNSRRLHRPELRPFVVVLSLITVWGLSMLGGCTKESLVPVEPEEHEKKEASCEGCHTDYLLLKKIASPDTAVSGGGCGGDTPHIEPYDRVFMSGAGFARFTNSTHGKQACTTCHGGVDST